MKEKKIRLYVGVVQVVKKDKVIDYKVTEEGDVLLTGIRTRHLKAELKEQHSKAMVVSSLEFSREIFGKEAEDYLSYYGDVDAMEAATPEEITPAVITEVPVIPVIALEKQEVDISFAVDPKTGQCLLFA